MYSYLPSSLCLYRAMGAMLQERSGELTPDAVLTLPELPSNPHGYCYFGHIPKSLPSPSSSAVSIF